MVRRQRWGRHEDNRRHPIYSVEEILAHPKLEAARTAYIDAVLAVYGANPAAIELMLDAGRILVFGIIMCLWGAYRQDDRTTWPTVSRVKSALAPYGVASPRQIDHLVGRLVQTGYVEVVEAPRDNRLRLVLPTTQMILHDRLWLRAHYIPLSRLFGQAAYARPMALDAAFQRHQHAAAIDTPTDVAREVVRPNLPILHFMTRSAGLLILMKLIQQSDPGSRTVSIPQPTSATPSAYRGRMFGICSLTPPRTGIWHWRMVGSACQKIFFQPSTRIWREACRCMTVSTASP